MNSLWPREARIVDLSQPWFNTLRLRQNDRYFPEDISKSIFMNENKNFFY